MANYQLQAIIGRKNETKLKEYNDRLKTLLYNAIVLLEDENYMNLLPKSNILLDALGMDEEEYKDIMGVE